MDIYARIDWHACKLVQDLFHVCFAFVFCFVFLVLVAKQIDFHMYQKHNNYKNLKWFSAFFTAHFLFKKMGKKCILHAFARLSLSSGQLNIMSTTVWASLVWPRLHLGTVLCAATAVCTAGSVAWLVLARYVRWSFVFSVFNFFFFCCNVVVVVVVIV